MNQIRTLEFLPEVFRTPANKKFLSATVDQLIREPELEQINGYIGRARPAKAGEYIAEPTVARQNYQLEPAIVFDSQSSSPTAVTFQEILSALAKHGATVNDPNRLFAEEVYTWAPPVDLDKLVNFSQYYWLPDGPDSVNVSASEVPVAATFEFSDSAGGAQVKGFAGTNPRISVLRTGEYVFSHPDVSRQLYIQAAPGTAGTFAYSDNISSRDVYGVEGNGTNEVTFRVPSETDQDFYYSMPEVQAVDLVTDLQFKDLQYKLVSAVDAIDGIQELDGLTIIFKEQLDGWYADEMFDTSALYDGKFAQQTEVPAHLRYSVWRISYVTTDSSTYIYLTPARTVEQFAKFKILFGTRESNKFYFKNATGVFQAVPLLTAGLSTLYYQDAVDPAYFGEIALLPATDNQIIDVDQDIIGQRSYTSGNGVEFTNGLKVQFQGIVTPEQYQTGSFYVEGVGESIVLVPAVELRVPEKYIRAENEKWDSVLYDNLPYDATLNRPLAPDYITINRASEDRNAWSRSNRWVHNSVIVATSEYNKFVPVLDNKYRGARPIVEFNANLELFNTGTKTVGFVDVIAFGELDALSNIAGKTSDQLPEYDGFRLQQGSRVIFANDLDIEVRSRIYRVNLVPVGVTPVNTAADLLITLVPDGTIAAGANVVVTGGVENQGNTYVFNQTWKLAQQKTQINQPPRFAMVDTNGVYLNDSAVYLSSSFAGCRLFGYSDSAGRPDPVLQFPLKYQSINNIGDIVFSAYQFSDTFSYVNDDGSQVGRAQDAYIVDYKSGQYLNGWVTQENLPFAEQVFTFNGAEVLYQLDVVPVQSAVMPSLKVFKNGVLVPSNEYQVEVNSIGTAITPEFRADESDVIEVKVYSSAISDRSKISIPLSLERNAFNETPTTFTLGSMRSHYSSAVENTVEFVGDIFGQNNSRDLGNYIARGNAVIQHSAPIGMVPLLTAKTKFNIFAAVDHASVEYEKVKSRILNEVARVDWGILPAADILDRVVEELTTGKTEQNPFYWTDMLPAKVPARVTEIDVTIATSPIVDTLAVYGASAASFNAVLIYKNDVILQRNRDYTLAADGPRVTLTVELTPGDRIVVKEYSTSYGSCVPDTPTKLGLYPAFAPTKFVDDTYSTPVEVIRGHDGSVTVAFGDVRDDVLLEFENRIYNNIKAQYKNNISIMDVASTPFNKGLYSPAEIKKITDPEFIKWLSWHRVDYATQDFNIANEFTWNYSQCESKLGGILSGHWQAIYADHYGTTTPHITPWEMLGFGEKPQWWEATYGPAPYTNGNLVLWDDIAAGYIADPLNPRVDPRYARPGLQAVIPVDSQGNLLAPFRSLVRDYDQNTFRSDWKIGTGSPAQAAWMRSSTWPFVIQKVLMATVPARYFAEYYDLDRYQVSPVTGQYALDFTRRLKPTEIRVADAEASHSYLNWLVDYSRQHGVDAAAVLMATAADMAVKLAYRVAGFTDKKYLRVLVEQTSPTSTNTSLVLPAESYNIHLHTNVTEQVVQYSGVIVEKTATGYRVSGFDDKQPFFTIYAPVLNNNFQTYTDAGTTVKVARDYHPFTSLVPYGTEFSSVNAVINFLVGYGRHLTQIGFVFDDAEGSQTLDWPAMGRELMVWDAQRWPVGSIITLNPLANRVRYFNATAVVDSLLDRQANQVLLNQDKQPLKLNELYVSRVGHEFELESATGDIISCVSLNLITTEHIVIFDNKSVFGDILYDPAAGIRQPRVKLAGVKTANWTGLLDAPGFFLNDDTVRDWEANRYYSKGEIVRYKNRYWSAATSVQPAEVFDFERWYQSDYEQTPKGLLLNLATKAEQSRAHYNKRVSNLVQDVDLLSFGIIGFRQRRYLDDLALDDISQVGVYSEFIQTKGTGTALKMFNGASVAADSAGYEIFENWAIKSAAYGATANRQYVEYILDEDRMLANPATVELIIPGMSLTADQQVQLSDVYKSSKQLTSSSVYPLVSTVEPQDLLPTAGFVNPSDVDLTVFSIADLSTLNDNLSKLNAGAKVWVAKANRHEWDVYQVTAIVAQVTAVVDAFNGLALVQFNDAHNLLAGDILVIRNFDPVVNGAHRVQQVLDSLTVVVPLALGQSVSEITGFGAAFVLHSRLVESTAEMSEMFRDSAPTAGTKVWVKQLADTGHWGVYNKTTPFTIGDPLFLNYFANNVGTASYGQSVAQSPLGNTVLVGDPNRNSVFVYQAQPSGDITLTETVALQSKATVNSFGSSIAASDNNWLAISSASDLVTVWAKPNNSPYYTVHQALLGAGGFGQTVALTDDASWLYVSAPGKVQIYRKTNVTVVPYQQLEVFPDTFATSGPARLNIEFATNENDKFTATQVIVLVDNLPLTPGADFTLVDSAIGTSAEYSQAVEFTSKPAVGQVVRIAKRTVVTGSLREQLLSNYLKDYSGIESLLVKDSGRILLPGVEYSVAGDTIVGLPTATENDTITVEAVSHFKPVAEIVNAAAGFGQSITVSSTGEMVVVGAPAAGRAFVYYRESTRRWAKVGAEYIVEEVEEPTYKLAQEIANSAAQFGAAVAVCRSKCSIYVGSPLAEKVHRYLNTGWITGRVESANLPAVWPSGSVLINGFEVDLGASPAAFVENINQLPVAGSATVLPVPNVRAFIENNRLVVEVISQENATPRHKLSILPYTVGHAAFKTTGLVSCIEAQVISGPESATPTQFGAALQVGSTGTTLFVGAPLASANISTIFDTQTTLFDFNTTQFTDTIKNNGVVYLYEMLPDSSNTGGQFVFSQEILDAQVAENSEFGKSISISAANRLFVGAPATTLYRRNKDFYSWLSAVAVAVDEGSSVQFFNGTAVAPAGFTKVNDAGIVYRFDGTRRASSWEVVTQQAEMVDVARINAVYLYNRRTSNVIADLDYIDPIQGKILGAARQNIDYIGSADPAAYTSQNSDVRWGADRVGEIWWNTENFRYLEYHNTDVAFSARQWGTPVAGSSIDVYQWVESAVPPDRYNGEVLSVENFSVEAKLTDTGLLEQRYYFWARNTRTVAPNKSLSAFAIARYIENPRASGIPFAAFVNSSTVALYNTADLMVSKDIVLHVEFDRELTHNNVHVEYDLIAEGKSDSFLSARLYRKLIDSFCGVDTLGNAVPDLSLPPAEWYGVGYRPRQSMFVDRFEALRNYITYVNRILRDRPITETRVFHLLNSFEGVPAQRGNWDKKLSTVVELQYQNYAADLATKPVGEAFYYLVEADETNNGRWTIYEITSSSTTPRLSRVQYYDTRQYWQYVNWYAPGFNSAVKPAAEVRFSQDLVRLSVPERTVVRVQTNGRGNWELYERQVDGWKRVGVENGTIQIADKIYNYGLGNYGFDLGVFDSGYYDQEPAMETRRVLEAINEELLVDDLAPQRNQALVLMFNFILTEQAAPEWLVKTSLIDVEHKVRALAQDEFYKLDNQNFVNEYIAEVKPYHTKIRELSLSYTTLDECQGKFTDFDVPSYFNSALGRYISPVVTTGGLTNENEHSLSDTVWTQTPWSDWAQTYALRISGIRVVAPGTGYTTRPTLEVVGDAKVPAQLEAIINAAGQIVGARVLDEGSGYSAVPEIHVVGGNGYGAILVAEAVPSLVRSIETEIKFDRVDYGSNIVEWVSGTKYSSFVVVRKDRRYFGIFSDDEIEKYNLVKDYTLDPAEIFGVETFSTDKEYKVGDLVFVNDELVKVLLPIINNYGDPNGLPVDSTFFAPVSCVALTVDQMVATNRVAEFYKPTPNQVGNDIGQLIPGTRFDAVWVAGSSDATEITQWNYDADTGSVILDPETGEPLETVKTNTWRFRHAVDTYFESEFVSTTADEANIDAGEFVSSIHSYGPEELAPGIAFDTFDMEVNQRPGADWLGRGFGFETQIITVLPVNGAVKFADLVAVPSSVRVIDTVAGTELTAGNDYFVDWTTQTIRNLTTTARVQVVVTGVGGGNQLYKEFFVAETAAEFTVPVWNYEIQSVLVFVNGNVMPALVEEIDQYSTRVLVSGLEIGDAVAVVVFGQSEYTASFPTVTDFAAVSGQTVYSLPYAVVNSNLVDGIVEINGQRLRPADSIVYQAPAAESVYSFAPGTTAYASEILIADVLVFKNGVKLTPFVDYSVNLAQQSVTLAAPTTEKVTVSVTTRADYVFVASELRFKSNVALAEEDLIKVITWNDTRELAVETRVFVGPTVLGYVAEYPFDTTGYDVNSSTPPAPVPAPTGYTVPGGYTFAPFDYYENLTMLVNRFDIGRADIDVTRMWVTLNGRWLQPMVDYTVNGTEVVLLRATIAPTDVLVVTTKTPFSVPSAINWRVFKDMRDDVGIYRIDGTRLVADVLSTDDEFQLADASKLPNPGALSRDRGIFVVNGERVVYRDRDVLGNTVAVLHRGTAGTGATTHRAGDFVADLSDKSQITAAYNMVSSRLADIERGLIPVAGEDNTARLAAVVSDAGTRHPYNVRLGSGTMPLNSETSNQFVRFLLAK